MNWKRFLAAMFALFVVLSLTSTRVAAQTTTTGDLAGVVTDPSGATVPGAKVALKDETKGNTQETSTNKDGVYHFYLLSPGPYTVSVTATGFQTFSAHANVAIGQIGSLNLQMKLGAATTSVTVTEAAPLVQTENGDTSTSLSQQQVANVPNPGNDLTAIAQLAPGVIVNSQGGYGNVEAFGLPATSNLFTMDGMDDNDPFLNLGNSGATNLLLGSNEVQEADVVSNAYSGAFGTFSGLQVNFITKSGGNQYHGNAVYYWNGSAMNANNWFNNDSGLGKPFSNANQWAASFGGPIKKDKLFFFVNTEGLRVLIPVPSTIPVPSQAFEGSVVENLQTLGDFASIPFYCQNLSLVSANGTPITCPAGVPGAGSGIFNIFNSAKNYGTALNSFGGGGCDNVGPGVGGGAGNIFNNFSATVPCTLSMRTTPVTLAPEWQIAGRFDWNVGNNDRIYMRMQYDHGVQPTYTDPLSSVFNAESDQPEYQGQLNWTHTFSPTVTNQFLLAATWYSAIFQSPDQAAFLSTFPQDMIVADGALPFIGGINYAFPQGRNVTQFQVTDDVSKTIGSHTLKVGFKWHKNYVSDHDLGQLTVPLSLPITLADFANGGDPNAAGNYFSEYEQNFPKSTNVPIRIYQVGGYVQDDWKVNANLTVSPALRIEHSSNPICVTNCFGQFAAPFSDIIGDPTAPYDEQLQVGRRNALLSLRPVQWEPRISFAWQPFGSATSWWKKDFVIRGGAGIFNDIFPGQIADSMAENPPLVNPFVLVSPPAGGTCPGFLSPNQPGGNFLDCANAANAAFNTTFVNGGNSAVFPPSVTFTPPVIVPAQYQKWSLEIQKAFGANDSVYVGYFGNHGIHEPIINNSVNAFGLVSELPAVAPTSQFSTITEVSSSGVSNYNGIVASYKHRFSVWGGGLVQFNYVYGHAFDIISNGGFNPFLDNGAGGGAVSLLNPQNPYNFRQNYSNADYDVRHSLNANYVWQVPIRKMLGGHGFAPLVDGWQVSGAVYYRTGFPFSVIDPSLTGAANYNADILPNPTDPITNFTCNSTSHFGQAGLNGNPCPYAAGFAGVIANPGQETTFGAYGLRNRFRGPSYWDTDFSFMKNTAIPKWESAHLGIGLQFFNLFNHPNFNLPSNDVTSPYFGTSQATVNPPTSILGSFLGGDASPRLIQVKAQLTF
jgi:Carboxypeptidase regulatory-like domain